MLQSRKSVLVPRKIGELELESEFEIPTWNSNWNFSKFTVRFTIKFTTIFTIYIFPNLQNTVF